MAKAQKEIFLSLEVGRFVASAAVVLTHLFGDAARFGTGPAAHFFATYAPPAPLAVQFFFVLSGFVMLTAHARDFGNPRAVPRFWWRRAARIYPMYWLGLGLVLIYLYAALSKHAALVQIPLLPVPAVEFISPAWTLRYEIAFYLMFGLCLLPHGRWLLGLWVIAVAWIWRPRAIVTFLLCPATTALKAGALHFAPLFFAPFEIFFFAGLAAGTIRLSHTQAGLAAILLGAVILAATGPLFCWGYVYGDPATAWLTGGGLGLVMLGFAGLERSGALRIGNWARKLGAISYPLYILHSPIMLCVDQHIWGRWHFHGALLVAFCAAYGALILGVSTAVAFAIDRPLQRSLRKLEALLFMKRQAGPRPN